LRRNLGGYIGASSLIENLFYGFSRGLFSLSSVGNTPLAPWTFPGGCRFSDDLVESCEAVTTCRVRADSFLFYFESGPSDFSHFPSSRLPKRDQACYATRLDSGLPSPPSARLKRQPISPTPSPYFCAIGNNPQTLYYSFLRIGHNRDVDCFTTSLCGEPEVSFPDYPDRSLANDACAVIPTLVFCSPRAALFACPPIESAPSCSYPLRSHSPAASRRAFPHTYDVLIRIT